MPASFNDLIAAVTRQGGEAVAADHEPFARDLAALLALGPRAVPDVAAYRAALQHGFAYYYWKWDRRAAQHYEALQAALLSWGGVAAPDLDLLCELLDFFYFVVWCFDESSTGQCRRALPAMRAASDGFARAAPARAMPRGGARRIAWLAMYAEPGNPMTVALRHVAPALARPGSGFELVVYAWRFAEAGFLDWLRGLGVTCHVIGGETPAALIGAIEARAAEDRPAIAISDMNNAIPTALFSRRIAPVQVLLQAGMPAWPVRNLDAVFNSFGFDAREAGWGAARMLEFNPPWDLASLDPQEDAAEVARERATLPAGRRLIGCYGRLVKVTEPYLRAVERILERCPEVDFATGGTGDAGMIRDFIAASPVGGRMHLEARFVPGRSWGRFLDVFLDTWPVCGGESSREMIAKRRPVVTLHSAEMPALDAQRDPALVAPDWDGFVERAVRLLQDPAAHAAACERAAALAQRMTDAEGFAARLVADLDSLLAQRRSGLGRLGLALRRALVPTR